MAYAVVTVAISLISYGIQRLLAPDVPKPAKPGDGNAPLQQPIPPRIFAVGRNRIAGSYVWFEVINGALYTVQALKEGLWTEVERYYLTDDIVTLNPDGTVAATGPAYRLGAASMWFHDGSPMPPGTPLSANPMRTIIEAFPGRLDADFRPDGVAALAVRLLGPSAKDFPSVFPKGRPQPSIAGRTTPIWDPRDPEQDPDDPTTWVYSANSALVRIWYETACEHGPQRDYRTAILPQIDRWIEEADICDELVEQYDGSYAPRFETHLWWTADTDRASVRASIMASCDGRDFELGTAFIMVVGKYRPATFTLTDEHLIGYNRAADELDSTFVNALTPKFTYPAQGFGQVDAPAWQDDESIIVDGLHSQTVELWSIQNQSQARRVSKKLFDRGQSRARGTLYSNLGSLPMLGDRWVRVQSDLILSLADAVIEVGDQKTALTEMRRSIDYVVINPNEIDAWEPEWEGPPPPDAEDASDTTVPLPTGVTAVAQAETLADNSTGFRLLVSWDEVADRTDLSWTIRYRQVSTTAWTEQAVDSPSITGGRVYATTNFVAANASYEVEVRASGVGGSSEWTTAVTASTSTDGIAPGSPTGLMVSDAGGGADISWYNPSSTNFASATIYRAVGPGGSFGSAVIVVAGLPGAVGGFMSYTDTPVASGAWRYWVTAENSAGTSSAPAGPVDIIIA